MGYPRATAKFESILGDDLRPSVHMGIISAVRLGGEIIQFDAQIDHGDSGGPVIDKATGSVVGIVRGSILDPEYVARGLELPLPGSNFGMSVATIGQVLSGAPPAPNIALAATTATSNGNMPPGGGAPSPGLEKSVAAAGSSAAYRVGYGAPHYTNAEVEAISQSVLQRLAASFTDQSVFYMIPVSFGLVKDNNQHLSGICDDSRLNAIVQPSVNWRAPLVYTQSGAPASLEATVSLLVTDCSAEPVFFTIKQKTEGTKFSNRTVAREVIDMANDLLDQALRDFNSFRQTNADAWDSLLKTGIFLNPTDGKYHALFFASKPKDAAAIKIAAVFANGPAAKAGMQVGDIIQSINGQSVGGMTPQQALALLNGPEVQMSVMRPGGLATLNIHMEKYSDLVTALKR